MTLPFAAQHLCFGAQALFVCGCKASVGCTDCLRLCAPVPQTVPAGAQNSFPDIIAVIQVALEGTVSKSAAQAALAAGQLPQGDLLPWMVGQQFQDREFPRLSGARIVRIACHPGLLGAGYGSKAVKELQKYYEGHFAGANLVRFHMTGLVCCHGSTIAWRLCALEMSTSGV